MSSFTTEVWLNCIENNVEVEVEYEATAAYKGYREGGLQMEPDEPESVDITSIKHEGEEITARCDEDALEYITEEAFKDLESVRESAQYDAAEARYEAMMEDRYEYM